MPTAPSAAPTASLPTGTGAAPPPFDARDEAFASVTDADLRRDATHEPAAEPAALGASLAESLRDQLFDLERQHEQLARLLAKLG